MYHTPLYHFNMEKKNLLGSFLWQHDQAIVWNSMSLAFGIVADFKSGICVYLQVGKGWMYPLLLLLLNSGTV